MKNVTRIALGVLAAFLAAESGLAADYIMPRRIYSALDAGADAFQFHDAMRREQIARQMDLNNQLLLNAYPKFYDPTGVDPFEPQDDCPPFWDYPGPYYGVYGGRRLAPYSYYSLQVGPDAIYYRRIPRPAQPPVAVEPPHPRDAGPREF